MRKRKERDMKHGNDYWEQEAYWELERRRAEKNRKTREQRRRERADTSDCSKPLLTL